MMFGEMPQLMLWVPTLVLVLVRVAGIFIAAPLLSDGTIPAKVKAVLALIISLGAVSRLAAPATLPDTWPALTLGIGGELLIGATLGYAASLLLLAMDVAGQQMGQQMGVALAEVFNPMLQDNSNVLSSLYHLTGLAIFLAIGGHRILLVGLLDSLGSVPLLGFGMGEDLLAVVIGLLTASFILGIKVAAPVLVAQLLASVSMGLIQRTMPQFNILSAGFQIRIIVGALVVAIGLGNLPSLLAMGWEFTRESIAYVIPGT